MIKKKIKISKYEGIRFSKISGDYNKIHINEISGYNSIFGSTISIYFSIYGNQGFFSKIQR